MKRLLLLVAALAGTALALGADPVVDGKVAPGEYSHSRKLMGDKVVLSWQTDTGGGLFVAVSAKTKGWVAVGLGTTKMDGAVIFIGSVGSDGTPHFSEDAGRGHGHAPAATQIADQSAVGTDGEWTTVEVHVPAALPVKGTSMPFIVSSSESQNITNYHGLFNHASGTMDLR